MQIANCKVQPRSLIAWSLYLTCLEFLSLQRFYTKVKFLDFNHNVFVHIERFITAVAFKTRTLTNIQYCLWSFTGMFWHTALRVLTIRKDINLQIWHQNVKFISSSYYIMAKFLSLSAINRSDVVATFACWKSPHVGMLSLSVKLFLLPQHFSVSSWLITWRLGHHACTSYFTRAKPVSQFVRD